MARCRCADACSCGIEAGPGVVITGTGTLTDPWVISALDPFASGAATFNNTPEVEFTLAHGPPVSVITATLPWVDPFTGDTGDVLMRKADGRWAAGPPTSVPPGSVVMGPGLSGDGSAGDPVRINLCSYDELKAACAP